MPVWCSATSWPRKEQGLQYLCVCVFDMINFVTLFVSLLLDFVQRLFIRLMQAEFTIYHKSEYTPQIFANIGYCCIF